MKLLFLLHLISTMGMFGVIWFVQVVHYPLFTRVGAEGFTAYEALHRQATFWVVAPLMLLELGTGLWLLVERPDFLGATWAGVGALLIGVNWGSTFFIQVPLHGQLDAGHQPEVIRRLVRSNWIRTVAWSLRAALMGKILWELMGS